MSKSQGLIFSKKSFNTEYITVKTSKERPEIPEVESFN
jgi:hypothetical protein